MLGPKVASLRFYRYSHRGCSHEVLHRCSHRDERSLTSQERLRDLNVRTLVCGTYGTGDLRAVKNLPWDPSVSVSTPSPEDSPRIATATSRKLVWTFKGLRRTPRVTRGSWYRWWFQMCWPFQFQLQLENHGSLILDPSDEV